MGVKAAKRASERSSDEHKTAVGDGVVTIGARVGMISTGVSVGSTDSSTAVGRLVGLGVGGGVGGIVGSATGDIVGSSVIGDIVGLGVGMFVGENVGSNVSLELGRGVRGRGVGLSVCVTTGIDGAGVSPPPPPSGEVVGILLSPLPSGEEGRDGCSLGDVVGRRPTATGGMLGEG